MTDKQKRKHAWYKSQRMSIAKASLRCQRNLSTEVNHGRRYSMRATRLQRMIHYYRNRALCLHVAEQAYYYGRA